MLIDVDEKLALSIKAATYCVLKSKEYKCNATFICDYHSQSPKEISYEDIGYNLVELVNKLYPSEE